MASGNDLEPGHKILRPCPDCGKDRVYRTGGEGNNEFYYGCDSCGLQLNKDRAEKSITEALMGSEGEGDVTSEIPNEIVKRLAYDAVSDLVTPARLHGTEQYFNNVLVYLEEGEQPDYLFPLTKGMFAEEALIVETGAEPAIWLDKNDGGTVVVSDRYVRIISELGEWTIPYSSITSVDIVGHPALHIHTEGRTYYIRIAGTLFDDEEELHEAAQYIRQKQRLVSGDVEAEQIAKGTEAQDSEDPIEKIRRLGDLKEDGVISDEEFENKKEELLKEI